MSLQTNLTMIKLLLNDIRSGAKYNSNDTKALRILIGNVHHAAMHKKLGIEKDIEHCDYVYMSEKFKEAWEAAGKPSGSGPLSRFGIYEHTIPLNVLIRQMVQECSDEQSIFDFISSNHELVFVTNEEDKALNESGFQRSVPADGTSRYEVVGIKIHPNPILYKNRGKRKANEIK
jgi:hypothetical protein